MTKKMTKKIHPSQLGRRLRHALQNEESFRRDVRHLMGASDGRRHVLDVVQAHLARALYGQTPDLAGALPAGMDPLSRESLDQMSDVHLEDLAWTARRLGEANPHFRRWRVAEDLDDMSVRLETARTRLREIGDGDLGLGDAQAIFERAHEVLAARLPPGEPRRKVTTEELQRIATKWRERALEQIGDDDRERSVAPAPATERWEAERVIDEMVREVAAGTALFGVKFHGWEPGPGELARIYTLMVGEQRTTLALKWDPARKGCTIQFGFRVNSDEVVVYPSALLESVMRGAVSWSCSVRESFGPLLWPREDIAEIVQAATLAVHERGIGLIPASTVLLRRHPLLPYVEKALRVGGGTPWMFGFQDGPRFGLLVVREQGRQLAEEIRGEIFVVQPGEHAWGVVKCSDCAHHDEIPSFDTQSLTDALSRRMGTCRQLDKP